MKTLLFGKITTWIIIQDNVIPEEMVQIGPV